MKSLKCEMCGSNNLVKQDCMYVCQMCGTKYTTDEAKKLMVEIEGTVDVQGTVKIDSSDDLEKLYIIARRAKEDNNAETALKYYDMISSKDPLSWEAAFYSVYYQSMKCKIAEIELASVRLSNCEDTILKLIKENVTDVGEQRKAVDEIGAKLVLISSMLYNAQKNHFDSISSSIKSRFLQEHIDNCLAASNILYNYGDYLIQFFDDVYGDIAADCWRVGIQMHNSLMPYFANKQINKDKILAYAEKIKKYDESYQTPNINTSGCYIATCVYGSYDCSQVWTLRRYRDYTLAETWYGRAFIHIYYAISPTIVKLFGNTKWFKKFWRKKLDRIVNRLHENGVEDTAYNDKIW